jgi:hypothetical protein
MSQDSNVASKDCSCGSTFEWSRSCGAWVCHSCDNHHKLSRCYCGWSRSGNDGRQELAELGECLDEDY